LFWIFTSTLMLYPYFNVMYVSNVHLNFKNMYELIWKYIFILNANKPVRK
jgi:hypothetical protein